MTITLLAAWSLIEPGETLALNVPADLDADAIKAVLAAV